MRKIWLLSALVLSIALALLDQFALATYLYWRNPWFDIYTHFLGGLVVGTLAIGLLQKGWQPWAYLAITIGVVIGWELFENIIGASYGPNLFLDTASDLLFDAIGVTIPYLIARKTIWR